MRGVVTRAEGGKEVGERCSDGERGRWARDVVIREVGRR